MTLDGLTLSAVTAELKNKLLNAKIQKVLMPGKEEIVLSFYSAVNGTLKLCISADAGDCAVYLTAEAKPNPKTAPAFCMFLRKHLTGAIVTDISQDGLDRVVTFTLATKDELLRPIGLRLIVEIMGKYSNIILTSETGRILDSIRRVSVDLSSKRQILPGMQYQKPPQEKFNPLALSLPTLTEALTTMQDTRITYQIISVFDGLSTQTAAEILYRSGITAEFTSALSPKQIERIAYVLRSFLTQVTAQPRPCIQLNADGLPVFFSIAPYETYPAEPRLLFETCNAMLDYYYSRRLAIFRLAQQRDSLAKTISRLLLKLEKRIHIYQTSLDDVRKSEKTQKRADLIIANLFLLKKGMEQFSAVDYETGETVTVLLDRSMTPQDLAQKLYKKIAKQKRAAALNTAKLSDALDEQDFLLGALHFTENAENSDDILEIRQTLISAGYLCAPPKGKRSEPENDSQPLQFISPSGYTVYVGKNDRQNDRLTMRTAAKDDLWFHAQKTPGSHVILKTNGTPLDEMDDDAIVFAARLAARYSRAKQSGKTPVDYTQRKNIKKPPNARPGKVIYDDYFTVYVDAND